MEKKKSLFPGIDKPKNKNYDKLRKKVWNKGSVKNPIAKELLQGDGRLAAKVVDKPRKPKFGKQEWLKELEENETTKS